MSAIVVKSLTPKLASDFLRFFDHERGAAFADNLEWAKCYCHFYNVPRAIDWPSVSGPQNRVAMRARIEVGATDGFLAFDGADVVGWMNAPPRNFLPHCFDRMRVEATPLPCEAFEAAVIVCFVVAPKRRRQGISRALLTAALASFTARGLKLVDAFPFKSGASELAADHYHGSLSMFLDLGFSVLREDESLTVVRKMLG
jgi:ribosomal protein S18 acetylase RimI-like enzyme